MKSICGNSVVDSELRSRESLLSADIGVDPHVKMEQLFLGAH